MLSDNKIPTGRNGERTRTKRKETIYAKVIFFRLELKFHRDAMLYDATVPIFSEKQKKDREKRQTQRVFLEKCISTFPADATAPGEPRLRRRLAPGRLTAMCHDRRTNAGNLQFSFALIDRAAASKAFTLAR